jgi:O-antigen/teichoic acid export membrane protein
VIVCLNIPGALVLLALDQKRPYLKVYALAMVLNISLNIILARLYQANGTIVAIFVTEFFIAMGLTRMVYRTGQVKQRWVSDAPDNMGY